MDEETALATIFANTKRHRRVLDLITIAESFQFLTNTYGSQDEVAKKTDLSREMVREFLQILTLPPEVIVLIKNRKIDSIDVAYRLTKVKNKADLQKVINTLSTLQAMDVRDIVRTTMENSETSIDKATEIVLKAKPSNAHIFIIDFSDAKYKKLLSLARTKNCSPANLIKSVMENWLDTFEEEVS